MVFNLAVLTSIFNQMFAMHTLASIAVDALLTPFLTEKNKRKSSQFF
jgi:hypothetical protein